MKWWTKTCLKHREKQKKGKRLQRTIQAAVTPLNDLGNFWVGLTVEIRLELSHREMKWRYGSYPI